MPSTYQQGELSPAASAYAEGSRNPLGDGLHRRRASTADTPLLWTPPASPTRGSAPPPPPPPPSDDGAAGTAAVHRLRHDRLWATYGYAVASLAITAASAAICLRTPAIAATSLACQVGIGVLLPTALGWVLMQKRGLQGLLPQAIWLSFSLLSGYGLLLTGAAGVAMMGAAAGMTAALYAPLIWCASRLSNQPSEMDHPGSDGASANTMASLYGINHGGALTLFVDPSRGGKMLQVLLSGFNLFLGIDFAVQHICEINKKAGEPRPYNAIAESIYLYTNFMSLYWTMARFLLPPPGSPLRPTAPTTA